MRVPCGRGSGSIVLLFITAALGGCVSAQPVLRLTPRTNDPVWVGGLAVTSKTGKSARMATAFAFERDSQLGFRVEIENLSSEPMLLDSNAFSFATCTRPDRSRPETCTPARLATDPEQVLLDLDIARSRQQAENANDEAFHGVMLLLGATAAVASAGQHHGTHEALEFAAQEGNALEAVQAREGRQVSAYELNRANWATAALRKTTLFPGQAMAGLVFTDRDVNARGVWLLARIGEDVFKFPFDQVTYVPRRRGEVVRR